MKFEILKSDLFDALQRVQHVVGSRTPLPILSNVLIEASEGELKLTTTDLDVGVTSLVDAKVHKTGATTLPVRRLAGIVRELPEGLVEVEVDANHAAAIKSGPVYFKINGLSKDDFPKTREFEGSVEFRIPQQLLKEGFKRTSYAISSDQTRYVLNGIHCSFRQSMITLVATDGRRLALVEKDLEFSENQETDIIIPSKAVQELQRLLSEEGDLLLQIHEGQVAFEVGRTLLVSKLIDGQYPNFRQVIPVETKYRVTIPREHLLSSIARVSLLVIDKGASVKLTFSKDRVKIWTQNSEVGEANESIEVLYDGPEMTIAFNPDYLLTPLRNLETEQIYLDLIDEMSPGLLRTEESFLYVLMPMRA